MSAKITSSFYLNLTGPACYQIKVKGELDTSWTVWFDGLTVTAVADETTLSGTVVDQSALHGLLAKIRDLGLPLVSVNHIESNLETSPG